MRPSLLALAPLAIALTGCGPNFTGSWAIALWEIEGQASGVVDDAGWIDFQDDGTGAYPILLRYQWSPPAGFVPYDLPRVNEPYMEIFQEEDWIVRSDFLFGEQVTFTVVRYGDADMTWEAEWPAGSTSRWSLERF